MKRKTSLMGGLLRSLTGKSGKKPKASEPGLLTRGISVIEERSEKVSLQIRLFSLVLFGVSTKVQEACVERGVEERTIGEERTTPKRRER